MFKSILGLLVGSMVGITVKTIIQGGIIIGRKNIQKAREKQLQNLRGRFDDLEVTKDDPKFYD